MNDVEYDDENVINDSLYDLGRREQWYNVEQAWKNYRIVNMDD